MSLIDKKTLEHLAELARIKLTEKEEEKLLHDLKNILTGGTNLVNVAREDAPDRSADTGKGRDAFPEHDGTSLKIPPMNL